jgi:hypothetical protein
MSCELVDEAEGAGVIPRAQEELLHNAFDFAMPTAPEVGLVLMRSFWMACGP